MSYYEIHNMLLDMSFTYLAIMATAGKFGLISFGFRTKIR